MEWWHWLVVALLLVGVEMVTAGSFFVIFFAVGALLTGLSGGLYAYFARSFNATSFGIGYSIELLMMVVLGSLTRVSGAIVGAFGDDYRVAWLVALGAALANLWVMRGVRDPRPTTAP